MEDRKCVLISSSYQGIESNLEYFDPNGRKTCRTFHSIQRHGLINNKKKFTEDEVIEYFKKRNCVLISKYTRSKDKIEFLASCRHKTAMSFDYFRKREINICSDCCRAISNKNNGMIKKIPKKPRLKNLAYILEQKEKNKSSKRIRIYYEERDWDEIQEDINKNLLIQKQICKKYLLHDKLLTRAVKEGKLIIPEKEMKRQSRERISKAREKFLKENPEQYPWKTQDSFISKPCEILKDYLRENDINFKEELRYIVPGRFFSADIALEELKIIIEVNGTHHYKYDGTLTDYHQERHDLHVKEGWKMIEVFYQLCYKEAFRKMLVEHIKNLKIKEYCSIVSNLEVFNQEKAIKWCTKHKTKKCLLCDNKISKNAKHCLICSRKLPKKAIKKNM